jgi:hypothetical protein
LAVVECYFCFWPCFVFELELATEFLKIHSLVWFWWDLLFLPPMVTTERPLFLWTCFLLYASSSWWSQMVMVRETSHCHW